MTDCTCTDHEHKVWSRTFAYWENLKDKDQLPGILGPLYFQWGDRELHSCSVDGQHSRNASPYKSCDRLYNPGLRLDPGWETWNNWQSGSSWVHYSAYKSPIYLLREGLIHIPSIDTWTAEERELHLFAHPSTQQWHSLPSWCGCWKNTWWVRNGRASCWQLPPLPRAMIITQWDGRPRQEAWEHCFRHVSLRHLPQRGLDLLVRPGSPAPEAGFPNLSWDFPPFLSMAVLILALKPNE